MSILNTMIPDFTGSRLRREDPLADIRRQMARSLAEQQDNALRRAISNHLGREDWSIQEVKPRLAINTYPDTTTEYIVMDGEPIMAISQVEIEMENGLMRASRGYKILNESSASTPPSTPDDSTPRPD